jgi:hypothetical protein
MEYGPGISLLDSELSMYWDQGSHFITDQTNPSHFPSHIELQASLLLPGLINDLLLELPGHARGGHLARHGRLSYFLQEAQLGARA